MLMLVLAFIFINLLAATLMAYDKMAAQTRRWRVPEASLFLLALLGASPAVYLMMHVLRHKSRKSSFQWRLVLITALQAAVLVVFAATTL